MKSPTPGTRAERPSALAELAADLNASMAANRRRLDALLPAASLAMDVDEANAARRLFDQFTDEQLWDLGKALMALSVQRDNGRPARSASGVRTTSTGRTLAAVPGGVA